MVEHHHLLDAVRNKVEVNDLRDYATPSNVKVFKAVKLENGEFARDINGNVLAGECLGTGQNLKDEIDGSLYCGTHPNESRARGGIRHKISCEQKRNGGNNGNHS